MIQEILKDLDNMDIYDKLKVYLHYYITCITIKYKLKLENNIIASDPNMFTFEEFINPANKGYYNNPNDWEHNKGIYDYYWKFKDSISKTL